MNARPNTKIPEVSCKKPSATCGPKCLAKTAVDDNRTILVNIAMGPADKNNINLDIFV